MCSSTIFMIKKREGQLLFLIISTLVLLSLSLNFRQTNPRLEQKESSSFAFHSSHKKHVDNQCITDGCSSDEFNLLRQVRSPERTSSSSNRFELVYSQNLISILTYDRRTASTSTTDPPASNHEDKQVNIAAKMRGLRARSPYALFVKDNYADLSAKNPGKIRAIDRSTVNLDFADLKLIQISKIMAESWKSLTADKKQVEKAAQFERFLAFTSFVEDICQTKSGSEGSIRARKESFDTGRLAKSGCEWESTTNSESSEASASWTLLEGLRQTLFHWSRTWNSCRRNGRVQPMHIS